MSKFFCRCCEVVFYRVEGGCVIGCDNTEGRDAIGFARTAIRCAFLGVFGRWDRKTRAREIDMQIGDYYKK